MTHEDAPQNVTTHLDPILICLGYLDAVEGKAHPEAIAAARVYGWRKARAEMLIGKGAGSCPNVNWLVCNVAVPSPPSRDPKAAPAA